MFVSFNYKCHFWLRAENNDDECAGWCIASDDVLFGTLQRTCSSLFFLHHISLSRCCGSNAFFVSLFLCRLHFGNALDIYLHVLLFPSTWWRCGAFVRFVLGFFVYMQLSILLPFNINAHLLIGEIPVISSE